MHRERIKTKPKIAWPRALAPHSLAGEVVSVTVTAQPSADPADSRFHVGLATVQGTARFHLAPDQAMQLAAYLRRETAKMVLADEGRC